MTTQPSTPPATDPQTPPAPPTGPTPTAPAAAPAPTPAADPPANPWDDPDAAKAEIERLRRENAKDRTTARTAAAEAARNELAQSIGKALGFVKDNDPVDPAVLTQQLEQAQATTLQTRVENAVMRAALAAGGNPLALLDSVSFLAKAAAIDPADTVAYEAAVKDAVAANPAYGLAPPTRVPAPNPAQGTSGAGAPPTLTVDQQIAEAEKNRDFAKADRLRAQQLLDIRKAQA